MNVILWLCERPSERRKDKRDGKEDQFGGQLK